MEEYIRFEIEDFGILFQYPEWWEYRLESKDTHLFWDEYLGSFRVTPSRVKQAGFSLPSFLQAEVSSQPGASIRRLGKHDYVCYQRDIPKADGGQTRQHYYIGGHEQILLACSFAYDMALLEDEFSAEGIDAGLEEVDILLELLSYGEED